MAILISSSLVYDKFNRIQRASSCIAIFADDSSSCTSSQSALVRIYHNVSTSYCLHGLRSN
jgi:hypothetical protein